MTNEFLVDGYRLTVFDDSFLIYVKSLETPAEKQISTVELPRWIFKSRNAIWLLEEESPMYERARRGDVIKHHLQDKLRNCKTSSRKRSEP